MDDHQHEHETLEESAPVAPARAPVPVRDPEPVRHLVRVALGGAEIRAPQYDYRAVTVINPTAQAVWVSQEAGEAERGRDGGATVALWVPAGTAVTEPIVGRELFLAAEGSGSTGRIGVYRWPCPMPVRVDTLNGSGAAALSAIRRDTLVPLSGSDGDPASLLVDNEGLLRTRIDAMLNLSALSDSFSAALDTSRLMAGNTALAVGSANVALAADGTLIAAQGAGNRIQIHALDISNPGGATFQLDDGAAGTRLMGPYSESRIVPFSEIPWRIGTANTLVHFNMTAGAGTVGITAIYSVTT